MIKTNNIREELNGITTVAISGHIRPDGDCVGSCMGLYLYLKENFPQLIRLMSICRRYRRVITSSVAQRTSITTVTAMRSMICLLRWTVEIWDVWANL